MSVIVEPRVQLRDTTVRTPGSRDGDMRGYVLQHDVNDSASNFRERDDSEERKKNAETVAVKAEFQGVSIHAIGGRTTGQYA